MLVLLFFLAVMALALPSPQRRIAPKVAYIAIGSPMESLYTINASIGMPPQVVSLVVDTGSEVTWVDDKNSHCPSSSCASSRALFAPAESSSYALLNKSAFMLTYGGNDGIQAGDYFTDSFALGSTNGLVLHNLVIGLAIKENVNPQGYGMFGLSPRYPPALTGQKPAGTLFLDVMEQQGVPTRSLACHWVTPTLDRAACYSGATTPVNTRVLYLWTNVSSVALTDSRGTTKKLTPDNFSWVGTLDSDDDTTYLTRDMFKALVEAMGAKQVEDGDSWHYIPCKREVIGSMDFEFGGLGKSSRIAVKFSDFLAPELGLGDDGTRLCRLKVKGKADGELSLNQAFLRSAYVVHHFDEKVLGIAQAKDVDQGVGLLENVVEIKPGDSMFRAT
ncbi:hypothetical protein LTR35_010368 [Friedmanniomyces endolithicus]|nr:hypothetical protein LTR35_010368 [Friedmanniomyces endolithicus]KAK0294259.1 hypothetical protein LTS00_007234 [Friedmanniomyces endolithicus]KAK1003279.1 hypothetical protein LTR54_007792 [Friedmanniomyces endolithicus]